MVVGTLSLVQKGQTSGCSVQWTVRRIVVYGGGDIVFGAKRSNQWTQWTQYVVHSGIVVYGVWDIVFGAKRSNQWIQWMQSHSGHRSKQWMQYPVDAVRSGIVVYGGGDVVLWCKKVKPVDAARSGCRGVVIYGGGDIHCIHWFDLFAPKNNVPTTLYHYSTGTACTANCIRCVPCVQCVTASTASTGLTFLHQRQCPHKHIPLFHCILHPLHTVSTAHCVHTIESLLCNSYTT